MATAGISPELARELRQVLERNGVVDGEAALRAWLVGDPLASAGVPVEEETFIRSRPGERDTRPAGDDTLIRARPSEDETDHAGAGDAPRPRGGLLRLGALGRGGMATVYRVHDLALDRFLAMKQLHAHFRDNDTMRSRFFAEARLTAQLAHPGIPAVHAFGESEGLPYFTMPEVRGRTLAALIEEAHGIGGAASLARGAVGTGLGWTVPRLVEAFEKVCEAVAFAHARGVVHCDLKPANVMVGDFGEVLVMDWGVARRHGGAPARSAAAPRPAVPGFATALAGTPAYMAPEQAMGELDQLGPPSDVYALGIVLYEILAGRRPFTGDEARLAHLAREGRVPPIERPVSPELVAVVLRALAPEPEARWPDAGALALAVARAGAGF